MNVSYSIAEDRTDIVDEGCQVDEFVMDGRRFFAWKDLSELSVERQDWIDYKDEPCTNVFSVLEARIVSVALILWRRQPRTDTNVFS